MHIVFAAAECVPFAKTGGLADVIGALPREIVRQGHQVTTYLPFYRQVQKHIKEKKIVLPSITIPFQHYNRFVHIIDGGKRDGVQFYFVDCPEFFDREGIYGTQAGPYPDNDERFGLYCRAVLESSKQLGVPNIFHAHDWTASMLPVMLRTAYYYDSLLRKTPTLLTVHNAGFQGWFAAGTVEKLLLPWDVYTMERLEFYGQVNFLKGGVVYSDVITTVSKKYAEEIKTTELGNGLDPVFRARAADLHGILNGVDYDEWNPETDRKIAAHYNPERLEGKAACRRDLLHAFGLDRCNTETPVLGIVSGLASRKGFDLLAELAGPLAEEELFLVILGTGEPYYENFFRAAAEQYAGKIAVKIVYDDTLAHKIEAGSDIFLMPSRYEPCGLNQIYSLKYGTPPVVHATGGLDDTIEEWNPETETGTGFKFQEYTADALMEAIRRALGTFRNKAQWDRLMRNGMARDFSWQAPAAAYIRLYEECIRRRS
jgi:starch synthase